MQKNPNVNVTLATLDMAGIHLDIRGMWYTSNMRLAILVERDFRPYSRLSVNIPDVDLPEDCFVAKLVDENEELREPLLATGLFEDSGVRLDVGFQQYEIWRLRDLTPLFKPSPLHR